MSSIKLKHSGGNGVIISAPSTNPSSDKTITLPSDGSGTFATKDSANSLQNVTGINGGQLGNRNLIINGAMQVAQRGTSFNQAGDGSYTLDRFAAFRNGAGIMDIEQSTTVPPGEGFKKSLKCTVDTADSSLGGADFGGLFYKIEGQDINRFEFGSSSAKQFTLSFFVRSNITGTYSVAFRNGSANRYLVKEYTISSANTWQKITITDTADLTGTWASGNTTGLQINWCLWEGGFSAAPNTWGSNNVIGSTNNVNWVATVGNTFYLTGVQLEVGSATDFEHRSFAQELALCQRYCVVASRLAVMSNTYAGYLSVCSRPNPVPMRAAPSLSMSGTITFNPFFAGGSYTSSNTPYLQASVNDNFIINLQGFGSTPTNVFGDVSNATITMSAEL